jgi:hypothetical protein
MPVARPAQIGAGDFARVDEGARGVPVGVEGHQRGGALESRVDQGRKLLERSRVSPGAGAGRFGEEDAEGREAEPSVSLIDSLAAPEDAHAVLAVFREVSEDRLAGRNRGRQWHAHDILLDQVQPTGKRTKLQIIEI